MEVNQIAILTSQLRAAQHKPNILTLSTSTLTHLLSSFGIIEEQSTSFHVKQPHNVKAELLRDLQFLHNYIQNAKSFKLYSESFDNETVLDVTNFKRVVCLEFHKVDVNSVKGLQVLRPQLQKLVCQKTSNSLRDVLSNCGGDQSEPFCWAELKEVTFVGNGVVELDKSLECAPWLHTLDLSHNEIVDMEALSCLPNLKSLNLSYNRLEAVPLMKGQICTRLQNLVLKNNFIEDVSGLRSLTNLWVLDLSNNCLVDHKTLLNLSHLPTLQWLNLQSNPLSFHPNHRHKTASYLHTNTSSTHFILDNVALSKNEKKLVGSYFPLQVKNVMTDSVSSPAEKVRRVRQVVIEEEECALRGSSSVPVLPPTPRQHLETKKQIEDLHERFGESWLNSQSGVLDVLGWESSSLPSSSPYDADFTIYSGDFNPRKKEEVEEAQEVQVENENINEEYQTQIQETEVSLDDPDISEERIYLATLKGEADPVFIVIEETHLSERDCTSSNEREKWHVDSILTCEKLDENTVQIDFDTMRKDKKQRIYILEDEIEAFVSCIKNKINSRAPKREEGVKYQCMKCSAVFAKVKGSILEAEVLKCPSCDSTLVVEHE